MDEKKSLKYYNKMLQEINKGVSTIIEQSKKEFETIDVHIDKIGLVIDFVTSVFKYKSILEEQILIIKGNEITIEDVTRLMGEEEIEKEQMEKLLLDLKVSQEAINRILNTVDKVINNIYEIQTEFVEEIKPEFFKAVKKISKKTKEWTYEEKTTPIIINNTILLYEDFEFKSVGQEVVGDVATTGIASEDAITEKIHKKVPIGFKSRTRSY